MNGFQRQITGWRSGQDVYGGQGAMRRRPVVAHSAFMRTEEIDREREMSGWNQYAGEEEEYDTGEMKDEQQGDKSQPGGTMAQPGFSGQPNSRMTPQSGSAEPQNVGAMAQPGWSGQQQDGAPIMPPNCGNCASATPSARGGLERNPIMPAAPAAQIRPEQQPYYRVPDYIQIIEAQKAKEKDLRMLQSMYPETARQLLPYIEEECDKLEYEGSAMFDEYPGQTTMERMRETIYEQVKDQFPEEPPVTTREQPGLFSMQYQGHPGGRPGDRPGQNWLGDLIQVMLLQEMHNRRCRHHNCRPRPF